MPHERLVPQPDKRIRAQLLCSIRVLLVRQVGRSAPEISSSFRIARILSRVGRCAQNPTFWLFASSECVCDGAGSLSLRERLGYTIELRQLAVVEP